jgi:hypothetical protein
MAYSKSRIERKYWHAKFRADDNKRRERRRHVKEKVAGISGVPGEGLFLIRMIALLKDLSDEQIDELVAKLPRQDAVPGRRN